MSRPANLEPIEGFLQRIQPKLRSMLARYSIPPREAEALLRDIFLTLAYKRESISSPERWLLRNLRQRCLLFWKDRKWQLYSRLDAALVQAIQQSIDGPKERNPIAQELETVLATLPSSCQGILRQRYGLGGERSGTIGDSPSQALSQSTRPDEFEACLATLSKRLVEFGFLDDDTASSVH